ncbi:MAG: hypothetical protein GX638_09650 [Crenarchaeota archaeon]|nr:hypothetical protein [Thermoproteota archaeon]
MKTKILLTVIAVFAVTIMFLSGRVNRLKADKQELTEYVGLLTERGELYKTKDSLNVLSVKQYQIYIEQYKQHNAEQFALIKTLNVDIKRLKSILSLSTTTAGTIETPIVYKVVPRDSIVFDTVQCVNYQDDWAMFMGYIEDGVFKADYSVVDSLVCVGHIVPKRFWFIKWGVKEVKVDVVSKNPNTFISNVEVLTIR